MSVPSDFVEYILDLLQPIPHIQTARMFGGVLLKVEGKQLGVLFEGVMYLKVIDPVLQERYQEEGSTQFTYTRKDKKRSVIIKNWWTVPEYALDNGDELVRLAEEVLAQEALD